MLRVRPPRLTGYAGLAQPHFTSYFSPASPLHRSPLPHPRAIPLLPRYTSAGPRLDKNGNERDPAERRRQLQDTNTETASLMLESRLRERRPGPGALRDDVVLWSTNASDPRVGGAGTGAPGLGGMGAGGGAGGFGAVTGAVGPGRRKHRNQGIRMIEADARRLMAAQVRYPSGAG
jgi:hypothetical protein